MKKFLSFTVYSLLFLNIHNPLLAGQIPIEIENKSYSIPTKLEVSILYENEAPEKAPLFNFAVSPKAESHPLKENLDIKEKLIKEIAFALFKSAEENSGGEQISASQGDSTALAWANFRPEDHPLSFMKIILKNEEIEVTPTYLQE